MARVMWFAFAFFAAGVCWVNAYLLLPTNPNYEPAWWKVVAAMLLCAFFVAKAQGAQDAKG